MKTPIAALLTAALMLSGCGGSSLNPFNWFGGGNKEKTLDVGASADPGAVTDPRPLVARVVAARIDRKPGGAIVHAVGMPPRQGHWDAELVAENFGDPVDGVLVLQFRAFPPPRPWPAGTPQSRQLTAAMFLSDQDLGGVQRIVVRGAGNEQTLRP